MNAFYFVTDEVFAYAANAQALWLRKLWPDCHVHLFIERRDPTQPFPEILEPKIVYHYEELRGFLPTGLPQTKSWPHIVFYRLFAPRLLGQYRRVCYLDSDVLCMYADPILWSIDLPTGLAMVSDYATNESSPHDLKGMPRDEWLATINIKSGRYANSGMLLIDPALFSTYRFEDVLREYFENFPAATRFDQDFLNSYMDGKWTELGPRFNYQAGILELGYERIVDPVFIHFCRHVKPWYGKFQPWRAATDSRFYDYYARIFADAGINIADYARSFPMPKLRSTRYRFRAWLSRIGMPCKRERRERLKWNRKSLALQRYIDQGLRTGRFADERTRTSIPKTEIVPIFDGRFLRPDEDGVRGI